MMFTTSRTLMAIAVSGLLASGRAAEPTASALSGMTAWSTLEWRKGAPSPFARVESPAVVVEGKLFLFGGFTETLAASQQVDVYALGGDHGHDKTQIDVNSCHRFDPRAKKWTALAGLPDGRSHFESSTIVHQGRILIVGGRCNASQPPRNVVGDLLEYDPKVDTWRVVGALPGAVLAPAAAIIAGRIVVTGGGLNNPRPLTSATWIGVLPAGLGR